MLRKIFKTGNSMVISIPKDAMVTLGVSEGSVVNVDLDLEKRQIVITSAQPFTAAGVNEEFARQVSEFIEQYRPALEALSKG